MLIIRIISKYIFKDMKSKNHYKSLKNLSGFLILSVQQFKEYNIWILLYRNVLTHRNFMKNRCIFCAKINRIFSIFYFSFLPFTRNIPVYSQLIYCDRLCFFCNAGYVTKFLLVR